ncbi:hypothetical protein LLEC1_08019 [Akanthomyces lecanii]|uniref:Tse2 ADP-ribosyltransferase toxin domain-containing protein n=1 Tax=Cordyceps confragosa TaxID=2714763 RepID=A0A179IKT7_CORDF|nr:hypothetical protein LLEC1_08019 [Akanthomyces lecanii]
MLSVKKRAKCISAVLSRGKQTRFFSPLAIYSRFPATLHYYQPKAKTSLFDRKEIDSRTHDSPADGVEVAADGLVYPKVARYAGFVLTLPQDSNGALFLPNTFIMQEFVRNDYDAFLDREESGQMEPAMVAPQIWTIPKGKFACNRRR